MGNYFFNRYAVMDNIRKTNMVVAQQITPHVALDPGAAQDGMYSTMSNVFYSTYLNAGLPGSVAASYAIFLGQIAGQYAAATAASAEEDASGA